MGRVVVVVAAVAATLVVPAGTSPAAAAAPPLFVVADSVMAGAAPAIHAAVAGWDVHIEARQGIFTSDAAELAWSHRDEIGAVAIVGTGYNYPVWNPSLFDVWIDQMMRRLTDAGAVHVIWATLREPPLGEHGVISVWEKAHIADHYPAANQQLRAARARWPQLVLADWNAASRTDGLTWDGLHLTPAGGSAMADLLADEVGGIGRLPAGSTLPVHVGDANAAALNLTVSWPRDAGYVTVWPCDQPRPATSNLNFSRHQTVANLVVTRVAADGTACLATSQDAHVIVDLEGTFASGGLITQNPVRALDTRAGGAPALAAGGIVTVPLPAAGVPSGARAAVVNLTATDTAAAGYLTAWPCDQPRPTASVLNHDAGQTVAGLAVVPVDGHGQICVFTFASAHVVVDVSGWFPADAAYEPVVPTRVLDTRLTAGRLVAGGVVEVPVESTDAAAVVTVTGVQPSGPGYLTAFPCGTAPPLASTVNYEAGAAVANLAIVGLGAQRRFCVASYASADVVVDVAGTLPTDSGYTPVSPVRLADTRTG